MSDAVLTIWTIYDHPADHPDWFVARAHEVVPGGTRPSHRAILRRNLEGLRLEMVAMGLTCLPREPGDEPHIVESWI